MSGVERDAARIKSTGEIFTPTDRVQKELIKIEKIRPDIFIDVSNTFIDPGCGDGQFLGEVLIRKMENGSTFEQALSTIYGVDLMIDNVDLCRERLLCGREDLRYIVEQNIYQADGLKFSYDFCPMSATRKKREEKLRKKAKKARDDARKILAFNQIFQEEKPKKKSTKVINDSILL